MTAAAHIEASAPINRSPSEVWDAIPVAWIRVIESQSLSAKLAVSGL